MKVLLITDSLVKGGKERRMLELVKGLKAYPDVSVEIVLFSKKVDYPEVFDMGVNLHYLERKPKKDPRVFVRFYELCKTIEPDVIHSWGSMPSVYAVPTAKMLGIKLINAMIADAPANMSPMDSRLLRAKLTFPFSDAVLGNSKAGLEAYQAPSDRSYCMYNGFDFRRIEALADEWATREKFDIQTPYVVGMVGAFADRKDYATYLKAAVQLVEKRDDTTFLAVGAGKNLEACQALVPDSAKHRIIFTGLQSNVESIINMFSIGILATNHKVHGEGISNAILEYMAIGKPVVATVGGGTPEIVEDGVTGFMVPPAEPDMLAEKIQYLLDHPDEARAMGSRGAEKVRMSFNLSDMADKYYRLYQQVIDKPYGVHSH
ncbi:glycosyltransferase [Pontibacter sp. G13]|uniref:glycosyltransferase n=1 Tax=Pontibacter sp. G13 TaxID=3074898 RepID=UPI00288A70D9|nr:glycosyltransferase [Pontibacter sp. G13]WNJ19753.1 glycosyltransferase [Pontibacter sp. G13]